MADSPFQGTLPNFTEAEIDPEKFYHYSMDPSNIGNQNKWVAFKEIGYQVYDDKSRWEAAQRCDRPIEREPT